MPHILVRRRLLLTAFLCLPAVALAAAGWASPREEGRLAVEELLRQSRTAHIGLDASALVSGIADTLVTVDNGAFTHTPREELREFFEGYFRGARYHAWDDVEPPLIRVSEDGTMAWAVRRVRVDREEPAAEGTRRRQFVSAWTATYERTDGGWRMTSVTSTFEPSPTAADRIVQGARRAAGWRNGSLPAALIAEAEVEGPDVSFEARVLSESSGAGRIDWIPGSTIARRGNAGWVGGPDGAVQVMTPNEWTMLVGHETHWNALRPDRLGPVTYGGRARFADREALRLTVLNPIGAPIDLYYAAADSLPLGFRTGDHLRPERGPVTVIFGDWRAIGAGRLPYAVIFAQDGEEYHYSYTRLELGERLAESEFAPPAPPSGADGSR